MPEKSEFRAFFTKECSHHFSTILTLLGQHLVYILNVSVATLTIHICPLSNLAAVSLLPSEARFAALL